MWISTVWSIRSLTVAVQNAVWSARPLPDGRGSEPPCVSMRADAVGKKR
jgi:hypothetical protein